MMKVVCRWCQTPIVGHPVSRCLDAMVAEVVWGYMPCHLPHSETPSECWGPNGEGISLLRYSDDIQAAWGTFQLIMTHVFSTRNRFFEALQREAITAKVVPQGLWGLQVLKDRMPLALCRAAILACAKREG